MVATEAQRFFKGLKVDRVTPTIVQLRRKLTAIKDEEVARSLRKLGDLNDSEREQVQRMASTLVNRILHEPSTALKRLAQDGAGDEATKLVETLFALEEGEQSD